MDPVKLLPPNWGAKKALAVFTSQASLADLPPPGPGTVASSRKGLAGKTGLFLEEFNLVLIMATFDPYFHRIGA